MKNKVITVILLSICIISGYFVIKKPIKPLAIDNSQTIAYIKEQQTQNIDEIKLQIEQVEIQQIKKKMATRSLSQRFKQAVVVGDSMVEALSAYKVLPKNSVAGSIGKRADNIYEQVDIALKRKPKHLFLCLGLNDISSYRKYVNMFKDNYQDLINYIKEKAPNTKIYINSMIPLPKATVNKYKEYRYISKYNQALKELCQENNLQYIDNTKLIDLKKNQFEQDGIHPKYDYFKVWAKHMADEAILY